jgi:glycosyltransferase involved in cell wall biosynthesis
MLLAGNAKNYLQALAYARRAHTVIVHRKTLPFLYLRLLRINARRLIFDFDDAIFCKDDGTSSASRMAHFSAIVRVCDNIFAGNKYLAKTAEAFNRNVIHVPTSIDTSKYLVDANKPETTTDIAWIGSSSTRKYLEHIIPALQIANQLVFNLRLKIIADFDLPNIGLQTLPVQWTSDSEAKELASAHIGIAPLTDDNWSRGKCGLKVLQYMATGLPVIASNVGVNSELVHQGVNGELACTMHDWVETINRLASDIRLRTDYGNAGRRFVKDNYSTEAVFNRILNSLNAMI